MWQSLQRKQRTENRWEGESLLTVADGQQLKQRVVQLTILEKRLEKNCSRFHFILLLRRQRRSSPSSVLIIL